MTVRQISQILSANRVGVIVANATIPWAHLVYATVLMVFMVALAF
jgi:hypothetical protein